MKKTALLLLLLLPLLVSCASVRTGPLKDTLRVNLGAEPPSLDWHLSTDNNSFDVIGNLMIGLTCFDNELNCNPACAKSWEISDNGKRYVFHLRPEAKWSDGKQVSSKDFLYAWRRLLDPATGAPYAFFLYEIENAYEYNTGKIKDPELLGISCPDDLTFEVRLQKPASYFINLTAMCALLPARKDIIEKHGNRWTDPENMVVNGPFKLKHWKHEYKIELESNPLFVDGEPKLKRVQMFMVPEQATAFALYESGQLDFLDNRSFPTPEVATHVSSPEYRNLALLKTDYIGFNAHKKPFDDARVRKAFSMAIERSVFPKILRRQEKPAYNFIPEGLAGYKASDPPAYNPEAARKLLAEAGYPDGKGFPDVEILYPSREDAKLIVEQIQDQLKRNLNLHLNISNQEFKVYMNTLHRDPPPIFRANWGADFPDPETFASVFVSHNANNHTLWTNPEYDRLVKAAEACLDPKERIELYEKADHLLCSVEAAIACTFHATQNTLCKPWVKRLQANKIDLLLLRDTIIDNDWPQKEK